MSLDELRESIDGIDNRLLEMFNRRMELVHEVAELKRSEQSSVYRPEREQNILDRLKGLNRESDGHLSDEAIEKLFLQIFEVSRDWQNLKVKGE